MLMTVVPPVSGIVTLNAPELPAVVERVSEVWSSLLTALIGDRVAGHRGAGDLRPSSLAAVRSAGAVTLSVVVPWRLRT